MKDQNGIYNLPLYYDVAFDFRDVPKEVDFLKSLWDDHRKRPLESILEVGCGPALHALEFARRKIRSTGLDLEKEMTDYARSNAKKEGLTSNTRFVVEDMIDFKLEKPDDMAFLLLDSAAHITTPEDFIKHLKTMAENLTKDGLYFIEFSHPADALLNEGRAGTEWEMEREGVKIKIQWGSSDDKTDPIKQTTDTTVIMDVDDKGEKIRIEKKVPQRFYLFDELKSYIKLSGVFELLETYGSLDKNQPFDNSPKSWRMCLLLGKKNAEINEE